MAVMIDLGELGPPDEQRHRIGHRVRRRYSIRAATRRRVGAIGLALVCLASLSASVRLGRDWTVPLWTGHASPVAFSVGSRSFYTFSSDGRNAIARDLHTGAVRWQLPVDRPPLAIYDVGGGTAAVLTRLLDDTARDTVWNDVMITLVDDETGNPVAEVAGVPVGWTLSGLLLVLTRRLGPDGDPCLAQDQECLELSAVHVRTGARVWRIAMADLLLPSALLPGDVAEGSGVGLIAVDVDTFATVAPDATLSLHDAESAAVLRRLALYPYDVTPGIGPQPYLVGRSIVTTNPTGGVEVTAYPADPAGSAVRDGPADTAGPPGRVGPADGVGPGGSLWSRVVPASVPTGPGRPFAVSGCGRLLCLDLHGSVALLDPDTGDVRALVPGHVTARLGARLLLTAQPLPQPSPAALYRETVHLVDHDDGRVLAVFPAAAAVPWVGSGGRVLLARQGPESVGFTILDETGRRHRLGSVGGFNVRCQAHADMLACADPLGQLAVRRLPW